jgi:hypothetical protein
VVVVNITFPVESSSQISLNLVCASGQSGAISQQMNQTDFISFELPVPDGCREPVLHLIEAKGSGLTSRKNDLRLIPVPYPIPAEPSSWVVPFFAACLASFTSLLAAFLGAKWSRSREISKARFDLHRSLVENEVAACASILSITNQMPNMSELDAEVNRVRPNIAPDSSVLPAYHRLQEDVRKAGPLTAEMLLAFSDAVKRRRETLLARTF